MRHPIAKVRESGNARVFVTERGFTFGYHNLVVDMRAFPMIRSLGVPVVFDVTHSLQLPGAGDGVTAGQAEFIEPLASAGVAAGVDGVFMEVHEDPSRAMSDVRTRSADRLRPPDRLVPRCHRPPGSRAGRPDSAVYTLSALRPPPPAPTEASPSRAACSNRGGGDPRWYRRS